MIIGLTNKFKLLLKKKLNVRGDLRIILLL